MKEVWITARYLTTKGELLVFTDYEVSNLGRVRNKNTGRFLAIDHNHKGYCRVHPCINGKMKNCQLHRLILSSFTDNIDGSLQVNHKDENKDNNCLTNLEWLTLQENHDYGTHNERVSKALSKVKTGVFNTKISKPVLQYDKSGAFIREWPSAHEVMRQLGISNKSISACCNGKYKSAGGYVWRYKKGDEN